MEITIYHNPSCATSRQVLEIIRSRGEEPEVIEYMKTSPSREELLHMLSVMKLSPRDLLRTQEAAYIELGLNDNTSSDERIIELMAENPILMNRPIVRTPLGTKLCRPATEVEALLPKI